MKRALLINPNAISPPVAPLGIEYLASYLTEKGHNVVIYDVNIQKEKLSDILERELPQVVGISIRNTDDSCYVTAEFFLDDIKAMVSEVKKRDIPVVLGGVGYSIMPSEALAYTGADTGIKGDGEEVFERIISSGDVPRGVIYAPVLDLGNFRVKRCFIDNKFYYQNGGMAGIETTRGCNRGCIYCADPIAKGRTVRFRSIESVVDEISQLVKEGITHYHLCDCEFNLSMEYAKSLYRAVIDNGLGDKISWYAYGVADNMDRELARLLKRAGCAGINFGVDHSDNAMLSFFKKGFKYEDVMRTVTFCREEGIKVMIDLLLGAPGETYDSLRKVIEDMKCLEPFRIGVSYGVRVYPGTAFYKHLEKSGYPLPSLLQPHFYLSEKIKDGIDGFIKEMIRGDERFYFNSKEDPNQDYNYNANQVIQDAIKEGFRGAFWDILARYQKDKLAK
ncbi:MAG: radical SAM protein [Nitrospira sp.]|nr:radical SAM protein [Nitrospira sp.]